MKEPPQGQLTMIGSDVHINCAVRGKPLPDITWRRDGELFGGEWQSFQLWLVCVVCVWSVRRVFVLGEEAER